MFINKIPLALTTQFVSASMKAIEKKEKKNPQ
jgi:hypothetical protein